VLKPSSSEPSIRPLPEKIPSATNELQHSSPSSLSLSSNISHYLHKEISQYQGQVVLGGPTAEKHGPLSTPNANLQLPQSLLIDLGLFDFKFREAVKGHFISCDMTRMCPWVDVIVGIFLCD
jgi:hypothetical protein